VNDPARVVPPGQAEALATALLAALETSRGDDRAERRRIVQEEYGVDRLLEHSESLLFGDTA
jgi:hypothetical protein